MWADDPENFHTNLPVVAPTVVDVVEEDNMNPVTSNAVAEALEGNAFSMSRIFDQDATSTSATYNLSDSILNYDFILCIATLYDSNNQRATILIPKEEMKINTGNTDDYIISGSINGTTRRVCFYFPTDTTLKLGFRDGTSGHLPHFWGIYGIKVNGALQLTEDDVWTDITDYTTVSKVTTKPSDLSDNPFTSYSLSLQQCFKRKGFITITINVTLSADMATGKTMIIQVTSPRFNKLIDASGASYYSTKVMPTVVNAYAGQTNCINVRTTNGALSNGNTFVIRMVIPIIE